MAFMATPAGGEGGFKVYIKYNAKAGRWYTREDKADAAEFEVTDLTAIFDMDNIKTGWFLFNPGVAPQKTMDPSLEQAAPKPGEGFKRGFELDLFSEKNLLGVREFSSTAAAVIEAMNDLHTDWEASKAANPGKVPVVKCVGVHAVVSKHGTNYKPQFEILKWVDRPAALAGASAPKAPTAAPASPPASSPAPAAPAAASDDDAEF